jgi:hypothetical protein
MRLAHIGKAARKHWGGISALLAALESEVLILGECALPSGLLDE